MVKPFRVGSSSAGHAPDENDKPATSIAAPEVAAQYFHRLRLYNLSVVGNSLLVCKMTTTRSESDEIQIVEDFKGSAEGRQ
jgi:vacuolar-type H+-ATPase catalytic subunit A/Vma1